jgi:NADH dehydrogenase
VLGAGFGGLSAALELGRLKKKHQLDHLEITVIDRNNWQLFTPDLYEIASASSQIEHEADLKKAVCVDAVLALRQQSVKFVHDTVERIDAEKKIIMTTSASVAYDYLIVALGSEPFYFGIPGMAEHSIAFKWIQSALDIRSQALDAIEQRIPRRFVLCGAGPAGVELAAELRSLARRLDVESLLDVTLVDLNSAVLSHFHQRAQRVAATRLQQLGVHLKLNHKITGATATAVQTDHGDILADVIIWTGGIAAHHVLRDSGLSVTDQGQLAVNTTLQTQSDPAVFCIGDAARLEFPDGSVAIQTAHEAVDQAPVAAHNIVQLLRGEKLKKYHSSYPAFVVSLGGKYGVMIIGTAVVLKGWIGYVARKYIDFRHFRSVLPFMHACSVWYTGFKMMNRNDS